MKTQSKMTLIAAALAAFVATPALANGDGGDPGHHQPPPVRASASATDVQLIFGNEVANYGLPNTSALYGHTGQNASGNIGVNIAAGDGNVQDNAAALASVDSNFVFGHSSSHVGVLQTSGGNGTDNFNVQNDASISDHAFQNASGNIGVNVAAGTGNGQKNTMAASVTSLGNVSASITSIQAAAGNSVRNEGCILSNNASLGGHAFSGASGNIGVNVAAGTGNLQSNSLSMAVSCTGCTGR